MFSIRLRSPRPEDRRQILQYLQAFLDCGDSLDGTAGLGNAASFEAWYQQLLDNRCEDTVRPGLVPATTLLAVDADTDALVGMIDIRHRLNAFLSQFGGHIGYSVHPNLRRRGYAAEMLRLALAECARMGIYRVLLTCDDRNVASARVIEKNGGILENTVPEDGRLTRRYWITLAEPCRLTHDRLNAEYLPLQRAGTAALAVVHALGFSASLGWYNRHEVRVDGEYETEWFPLPVVELKSLPHCADLGIRIDGSAWLELTLPRAEVAGAALARLHALFPFAMYGARDYLTDLIDPDGDASTLPVALAASEEESYHLLFELQATDADTLSPLFAALKQQKLLFPA